MNLQEANLKIKQFNSNFTLLKYISMDKEGEVLCNKCNNKIQYKSIATIAYKKVKCPCCLQHEKEQKFIQNLKEIRPQVEYLGGYTKRSEKVQCKCLICGNIFYAYPNNLLKETKNRIGCSKCLQTTGKTQEEFLKELSKINPNIEILSKYTGYFNAIKCKCKLCNYIFEAKPEHLLRKDGSNTVCPKCQKTKSRGEQKIADILHSLNIKFIEQYYINIDEV